MTILIDGQTLTELGNYTGLVAAVGKWLERDDLVERVPYFVQLAEARFRRIIRNPERETALTISLDGSTPLPADFDSARLLLAPSLRTPIISEVSPAEFYDRERYATEKTVFTVVAGQILISPVPTTPLVATLIYNAGIPALGAAMQTNWLLAAHPDLYLLASLLHAELYGWNDARLPLFKSAVDEILAELSEQGMRKRYGTAPLIARTDVREAARGAYRR